MNNSIPKYNRINGPKVLYLTLKALKAHIIFLYFYTTCATFLLCRSWTECGTLEDVYPWFGTNLPNDTIL